MDQVRFAQLASQAEKVAKDLLNFQILVQSNLNQIKHMWPLRTESYLLNFVKKKKLYE